MRMSALKYAMLLAISNISMIIIALLPFHAFFTVWISSLMGHYTALRLWKEVLLLVITLGAIVLVTIDQKIRRFTLSRHLTWLIQAYFVVIVARGLIAFAAGDVTLKALLYGLAVDLRYLAFFLVVWAAAVRTSRLRSNWRWIIIVPSMVVVVFGLLQAFALPNDFLKHFGYGSQTIPAFETINSNDNYVRIASTLRGPNPLGAYMIIPISIMLVLLSRNKLRRNWQYLVLLASYVVLFFSFSRSAWIGALLATIIVVTVHFSEKITRKRALISAVIVLAFLGGFAVGFRNNSHFQNVFLHTEDQSQIAESSNDGHVSAVSDGLHDIVHEPLGRGTGTAGPASVYNDGHARISENYFLQVGQEAGVIGLVLLLIITGGVGYLLWIRRDDALALSLFAALVGLTFVNLLSHAWSDDTLAYVFWGLAGIAMVTDTKGRDNKTKEPVES